MLQRFRASLKTFRVRIIAIVALCWLLPMLVLGVYMSGVFVDALRATQRLASTLAVGFQHIAQLADFVQNPTQLQHIVDFQG